MGGKSKNTCLNCGLPVYCKNYCRRHYKKYLAVKNGTYKKDYARRKLNKEFMERKRILDKIYREKKKAGIPTPRATNDKSLVNTNWKEYFKRWYKNKYRERNNIRVYLKHQEDREKVIRYYSGGKNCCAWCGIKDIRVLEIDHISNDGSQHRKEIGQLNPIYWIMKNNFPPGFQILCRNCNGIKELQRRKDDFIKNNFGDVI